MNHWESPITQMMHEASENYVQEREDALVTSVSQTIGYTVDKDELIKALNYDRQQYEKGYEDGKKDALTWIPVSSGRLPDEDTMVIGITVWGDVYKVAMYDDCGEKKWYGEGNFDVPVESWIPFPEPHGTLQIKVK